MTENVTRPLPYITGHIKESVSIGWKHSNRRGPFIPTRSIIIRPEVHPGKLSLPDIGFWLLLCRGGISPDIDSPIDTTTRSILPFRFSRQLLICPLCISNSIFPGDMHYRMIHPINQVTAGSLGSSPGGTGHIVPPLME